MSDNKDKDENDDTKIVGDSSEHRKVWLIEWKNKFGKTLYEETHDYTEALSSFDEKGSNGIDAILYEVQKSPSSSVVKKTPILNSVKARQRRKEESESTKLKDRVEEREKRNNKSGSIRYRIILLIVVIGMLVLVISLINALANEGGIILNPQLVVPIIDADILTAVQITISYIIMNVASI